jgi:hypothetical protein
MRARATRQQVILFATSVLLLAIAQAMPAATAAGPVLFDSRFDLQTITTQDATVSELKTGFMDIADTPYRETIVASREVGRELYRSRLEKSSTVLSK